jgi:hypothetical protein
MKAEAHIFHGVSVSSQSIVVIEPPVLSDNGGKIMEQQIRFKGEVYVLIGDMESGGAIATPQQFENWECSFAHLYPNGDIKRFGEVIGRREDIQVMNQKIECRVSVDFEKIMMSIMKPEIWKPL